MKRPVRQIVACLVALLALDFAGSPPAFSDEASPAPSSTAAQHSRELARRIGDVTDVVLGHHIDPPVRQQMILGGVKALYRASGSPVPSGLSRRVSSAATREQLEALLAEAWPKAPAKPMSTQAIEEAFFDGLLESVAGGAHLVSAKERKVAEQMEGNRYVGIQIALTMDEPAKLTRIAEVFEGGPADRAGAKVNDLIETIDGIKMKGKSLRDVIDHLRGDEGTGVAVTVRQPNATASRSLKMTRASMPRTTVSGVRKRTSGGWDLRIDGPGPIGYLRIGEISASTPHEVRNLARQLEDEGARAVVLDLRGLAGTLVHPTVLLADSLLDHGMIGRVRTIDREMIYEADSDALFQGWPMAVLVDDSTRGTAEWLAAALQDNHRAILVGRPTRGALGAPTADVRSNVPIADGTWSINLATGYLERGDGRPLSPASWNEPRVDPNVISRPSPITEKMYGGVRPEHPIFENRRDGLIPRESGPVRPNNEHNFSTDMTLRKAMELLLAAPKKA